MSSEEDEPSFAHYGTPRHSGRYPWGSGDDAYSNSKDFLGMVEGLRKQGLTEVQIAEGVGLTTTQLRTYKANAKNAVRAADITRAQKLKATGMSNMAIGKEMGINESSVRALLRPGESAKAQAVSSIAERIKSEVDKKKYVDIGAGVPLRMKVPVTKFDQAIERLQAEGYVKHKFSITQLGTGLPTNFKVLAVPGTTYPEMLKHKYDVGLIEGKSDDGGHSLYGLEKPLSISSKRVDVRYKEDGGSKADGVIYVRPGVPDVSLKGTRYAQVRISVDDTHFLKGMAIYKKDLPEGVDLQFNTNKSDTGNKLDAMKKQKRVMAEGDDPKQPDKFTGPIDKDNPFGAVVEQIGNPIPGKPGRKKLTSVMNLVNEEGDWDEWSKSLSTQMLSKQPAAFAKQQIDLALAKKRSEFDEVRNTSNPEVKKRLLMSLADAADSTAVTLKAAHMPRQSSRVILPVNSLKPGEIYAPGYRDGEQVVLIRYPHGGIFEIPQLKVNNKHKEANELLGDAKDAVGIHSDVAEKLSGADFDGDTVLVIPNPHGQIKIHPSLAELKGFNPQEAYPKYDGMPVMSARYKQVQMGVISNLITDMTIQGAPMSELARAVKHSMVVIDAEKHKLNYRQSAKDNNIAQLKAKYQNGGASTVISNSGTTSKIHIPNRREARVSEGGPIDRKTGARRYVDTGESFVNDQGQVIVKSHEVPRLSVNNAAIYSSGRPIEKLYVDYSNALKDLANKARLEMLNTQSIPYSTSANKIYAREVASLKASLTLAQMNAPLERRAQVIANAIFVQKKNDNPDMDDAEAKKVKYQSLREARNRTGAGKQRIVITPEEWNAIQAGAITKGMLNDILSNTDLDGVKALAMPRSGALMSPNNMSRARSMLASGYDRAAVADALGVSVSTLQKSLNPKEE